MPRTRPTTLITGAAKRIGAAIARHLAGAGHDLVLHYHRSGAEAEALAATLSSQGAAVSLVQADLSEPGALGAFWEGLPAVTHLVHNAASFAREPFTAFTAAQLRTHLAINLESPLILSQGFLAQLPEGTAGSVTVLGDGAMGYSISLGFFPYAVSKHAWTGAIELLAASLAPRARANLVTLGATLPGSIDDAAMFARIAARTPLQRRATPEDACAAVRFLIDQPNIAGQVISLAAGMGLKGWRPES